MVGKASGGNWSNGNGSVDCLGGSYVPTTIYGFLFGGSRSMTKSIAIISFPIMFLHREIITIKDHSGFAISLVRGIVLIETMTIIVMFINDIKALDGRK